MLDYSIMKPEGILILKPDAPLTKEDFSRVSAAVDSYLSDHARLHGVLIHTKGFPGWEDFGGPGRNKARPAAVSPRHKLRAPGIVYSPKQRSDDGNTNLHQRQPNV